MIAITGADGFIGSSMYERVKDDFDVIRVDFASKISSVRKGYS